MRSAAAWTSGLAFPIAIPRPAARIIGRSLTSSPTAQIWEAGMPAAAAIAATPLHFVTAAGAISHIQSRYRGLRMTWSDSSPGQAALSSASRSSIVSRSPIVNPANTPAGGRWWRAGSMRAR